MHFMFMFVDIKLRNYCILLHHLSKPSIGGTSWSSSIEIVVILLNEHGILRGTTAAVIGKDGIICNDSTFGVDNKWNNDRMGLQRKK
jgi:hypothetical protein